MSSFERAKKVRNRVIHDAIKVDIDFDGTVHSLAVQYDNGEAVWLHKE